MSIFLDTIGCNLKLSGEGDMSTMMKKDKMPTQQSLDRALELIEVLAKTGIAMNVAEISKKLAITRTTTYSMLQSLLQRNYVEKDAETGKYSIGYKLYEMAMAYRYQYPFLYVAEKHIGAMAEKWKIRINICVLKSPGVAVMILSRDISLLPKMILGYVLPGYASASGKLLMAYAPRAVVEEWLEKTNFVAFTPNTVVDKDKLLAELDEVNSRGFAVEREELMSQRCCIAAPIRNISGQVIASVSCSGLKEMMDTNMAALTEDIVFVGKSISSELGYNPITFQ
jgi:DNA-binding IclR family transcriptional regulator